MKLKERVERQNDAYTTATLTVFSAFIGVSLFEKPDNAGNAMLVACIVALLAVTHFQLNAVIRAKGNLDWSSVAFASLSSVALWYFAAEFTDRPWIIGGLILSWIASIFWKRPPDWVMQIDEEINDTDGKMK